MEAASPGCPQCGSQNLAQLINRVAVTTDEETRLERLADPSKLAGLEDDPKALGRYMQTMARETGEEFGEEFTEVADRLQSGEPIESIDESMASDLD
jgi:hypothetical protein